MYVFYEKRAIRTDPYPYLSVMRIDFLREEKHRSHSIVVVKLK